MIFHVAPMMGYTDYYFRNLLHFLYGDRIKTYSEMIVDKAIIHNTNNILNKHFCYSNRSVLQIAGSNPKEIKECIKIIDEIPYIKEINFNLGCPSSRVQENNLGLSLTQYPEIVENCLEQLIKSKKKISVKCRLGLGLKEDQKYIDNFILLFKKYNINKIIIHCRNGVLTFNTKNNRKIPNINYELFFKCKKKYSDLILIPNGEINNQDIINYFSNNLVKEVMIGRKFSEDPLFLNYNEILQIEDIGLSISNYLDFIQKYPIFKINLLIKSLLPLFNNLKDSKKHKKLDAF